MASNDQVSSMLLLILIGVAIYFLCYSDGFSSTGKNKEFFEDLEKQSDIIGTQQNDTVQFSQPAAEQSNIFSNNIIQEIINEPVKTESVQQMEEPKLEQPMEQPKLTQQQMEKPIENQPTVMDFTGNDEMTELGVDLNAAFMTPLPPGTNPDEVNFKKVNNDNYNAKDFLPKQINDEWFETDFSLAKYQLNDDKLINTERYMIGINTVGQSLKNATYDIRGTIANPKLVVSPWNNSTYEPDFNLKPLC